MDGVRSTGHHAAEGGARRVATNLVSLPGGAAVGAVWAFDLDGISDMFRSYETTNLWPFLERPQARPTLPLSHSCMHARAHPRPWYTWGNVAASQL